MSVQNATKWSSHCSSRTTGTSRQHAHLLEVEARLGATAWNGSDVPLDRARVISAVRNLPRRQADCIALQFYLECSEREIATTLGISAGSVKQHLSRARKRLATELEELA